MIFVADVSASAEFFRAKLGFDVDFLHGEPPFYASVSRDGAVLHLRFAPRVFVPGVSEHESLLAALIEVDNIKALYGEFLDACVEMVSRLTTEPWGATGFTIGDPDGNRIGFSN